MGKEPTGKGADTGAPQSLVEFARAERQKDCPVCRIPEEVRREVMTARDKKIDRRTVLTWLKAVHGYDVTDDEMTAHRAGNHDKRLRELAT